MRRLICTARLWLCCLFCLLFPLLTAAQPASLSPVLLTLDAPPITHPGAGQAAPADFTVTVPRRTFFFITITQHPLLIEPVEVFVQRPAGVLHQVRLFHWPESVSPPSNTFVYGPLVTDIGGTVRVRVAAFAAIVPFSIAVTRVPQPVIPVVVGMAVTLPLEPARLTFLALPVALDDRFALRVTGSTEADVRIYDPIWGMWSVPPNSAAAEPPLRPYWVRSANTLLIAVAASAATPEVVTVEIVDHPIPRVTPEGIRVRVPADDSSAVLVRLDYEPGHEPGPEMVYFELHAVDDLGAFSLQLFTNGEAGAVMRSDGAQNFHYSFYPTTHGTLIIALSALEPREFIISGGSVFAG